jgi:hypothetical protein
MVFILFFFEGLKNSGYFLEFGCYAEGEVGCTGIVSKPFQTRLNTCDSNFGVNTLITGDSEYVLSSEAKTE